MNERAARMTVAVVKLDAEAEPHLTFAVYKGTMDQTPGHLVLDLIRRSASGTPERRVGRRISGTERNGSRDADHHVRCLDYR
jgi:hypothetical protein